MAKVAVAKRVYVNKDGDDTRSATPQTIGMRFEFVGGKVLTIGAEDIHKDVRNACMWHGVNQKAGDAFAGSKGDADAAYEAAKSITERLAEGTWVQTREGAGPSTGVLVDAIVRALIADGKPAAEFDDARKAAIAAKLKGETPEATKANRAGAMANPAIKAAFEAIKAERAVARAKTAATAAKGEKVDLGAF